MRRDSDVLALIETKARTLARSGEHHGWQSIERTLLRQGFLHAQKLFANRWTQTEVNRLCDNALSSRRRFSD
jgi:hypothetical protein